jgi:hypothetical protein
MRWPRGKYNGRRIIGLSVECKCYLMHWYWLPHKTKLMSGFHWLCFSVWFMWVYE